MHSFWLLRKGPTVYIFHCPSFHFSSDLLVCQVHVLHHCVIFSICSYLFHLKYVMCNYVSAREIRTMYGSFRQFAVLDINAFGRFVHKWYCIGKLDSVEKILPGLMEVECWFLGTYCEKWGQYCESWHLFLFASLWFTHDYLFTARSIFLVLCF